MTETSAANSPSILAPASSQITTTCNRKGKPDDYQKWQRLEVMGGGGGGVEESDCKIGAHAEGVMFCATKELVSRVPEQFCPTERKEAAWLD